MSALQIAYLVVLAFCILSSGFFSGSETALIGIGRERVHRLGAEEGRRGARVAQLVAEPDRLLSTLLVANNLVNILGASIATVLFVDLVGEDWGPWVATGVVTTVILIVGEITPKTLATRYPERFSMFVAPTIYRLSGVLGPIARFFSAITNRLLGVFGISQTNPSDVTEADIKALAMLGEEAGGIDAIEREIIDALFGLADRPVRDIMTPRVDIATLTLPISMDDVRYAIATTGHSRYLVSRGALDDLVGILYVKDLLRSGPEPSRKAIERIVRTPYYVPESAGVLGVLQEFRLRRRAFGVVLDEHGGVEGIVTIKDLVSELVGELQDEYDPGAPSIVMVGPSQWLADGRLPLEELVRATGRDVESGPFSTAAGYFLAGAGHIPSEGDALEMEDLRFTVLQMDRYRIDRLRIERL
ncbi:MAG: HlyC/CorC family transporter [Acidimicrobiia bacterium]|nr:HlyC/CorC family transporter [Acidimicrobiia bacterium]